MTFLRWTSAVLALALVGCSDPASPGAPDASPDAATADASDAATDVGDPTDAGVDAATDAPAPAVPFSAVQALLTRDCTTASCHGHPDGGGGGAGGLFLTPASISYSAMVARPSVEVPAFQLVAPGDPDHSYLVLKVEGTMRAVVGAACATSPGQNPCGAQMPQLAAPLSADERALIRNWISAGAPMD